MYHIYSIFKLHNNADCIVWFVWSCMICWYQVYKSQIILATACPSRQGVEVCEMTRYSSWQRAYRRSRTYPVGHRWSPGLFVQQVVLSCSPSLLATQPSPLYSYHVNAPYRASVGSYFPPLCQARHKAVPREREKEKEKVKKDRERDGGGGGGREREREREREMSLKERKMGNAISCFTFILIG